MKKIITIAFVILCITIGIYYWSTHDAETLQLAGELKKLELQNRIEETKRQAQQDVIKYQLARQEQAENATITANSLVRYTRIGGRALLSLWPLWVLTAMGAAGAYILRERVQFQAGDISVVLPIKSAQKLTEKAIEGNIIKARTELSAAAYAHSEDVTLKRFGVVNDMLRASRQLTRPEPLALPEAIAEALPNGVNVPSFQAILTELEAGDELYLGTDIETGEPITGNFDNLYSSFLAGRSGFGKSSWLRALILQSLIAYPDIKIAVLDPHSRHKESLTAGLPVCHNIALLDDVTPEAGLAVIEQELDARLSAYQATGEVDEPPLVFVCDELAICVRRAYGKALSALIERISNEGRKACVYALLSSQDTRCKKTGDFRDMLSSSYCFRLKKAQARYLLDDNELAGQVARIREKGVALFAPTDREERLVKVPYCSTRDVQYLQQRLVSGGGVVDVLHKPVSKPVLQVIPGGRDTSPARPLDLTPELCKELRGELSQGELAKNVKAVLAESTISQKKISRYEHGNLDALDTPERAVIIQILSGAEITPKPSNASSTSV